MYVSWYVNEGNLVIFALNRQVQRVDHCPYEELERARNAITVPHCMHIREILLNNNKMHFIILCRITRNKLNNWVQTLRADHANMFRNKLIYTCWDN